MKVDTIQTSFAGGEFGPSLYGRTDISQYQNACEIIENFIVRPYGSAISAPGSRYVATVSDSTLRTRLIKFIFNRTDAYVIEMGDLYMRYFTNRGQVVTPSGSEDLSSFGSDLKAHWKMNDNTNSTIVLDATGNHSGTIGTLTSSVTTTAIVDKGFNLNGLYHAFFSDHIDFTRTASTQPMSIMGWAYYDNNGSTQALISKAGEYQLSINSSNELSFETTSGDADTKLLLHCEGADASTTFTDSSTSAHTITAGGNVQVDTDQFKFGSASAKFDGAGDFLKVPSHTDFAIGTNDFTIDFWVKFQTFATSEMFVWGTSDTSLRFNWNVSGGGRLDVFVGGTAGSSPNFTTATDTWYHVAVTRESGTARLFINGDLKDTWSAAGSIAQADVRFGTYHDESTFSLHGWMDEIRILNGTAVWNASFSPSSDPYQSSVSNSWTVDETISEGWHFFGVVFKGTGASSGDCKIYIDGESKDVTFSSDPSYIKMQNTTSLFRIGASTAGGANNWQGKVDNWGFIHLELSPSQIAGFYSTTPYQLTTVFSENEVFDAHYAQLNDIIWLAHTNHPPQQLVRTSANEWTISDFDFKGGPFLDENTDTTITITPSATTGTINITVAPTTTSLFTLSSSTLGHHGAYWMIGGLAQTNTTTGLQEMGYVQITNVINSYTATATVIKNLKSTTATTVWAEGAWSAVRGYPSKVSFHDARLWFGRTNHEPQKIWGSKIFEYDNFALDTQDDDDALNLPLASNESNELQWISSTKKLLSGTYGGGFVISSGADNLAITPDNVRADEEIGIGSAAIAPKRIGQFLYYLQRFKMKLREIFYVWDLNTYKAVDRTILSPHILGNGAVDMDVQINPDPILYCVRTEGTLALLTREADQEFAAWSRRTTNGTYTSVAVIPSQTADYDETWTIVERWIKGAKRKYVEYFENISVPSRQDQCLYLDSALTYDAYQSTSTSNVTISLSASSGSVTLTSSSAYFNGGMIGKRIRAIDANGTKLGEGSITATTSTTSITLSITSTFNSLTYAAGRWGVSVSSVSGLDHLSGKTVGILADGVTESLTRTVASSSVSFGSNYFVVSVGLPYNQIILTLPKEAGAQRGTAQGKLQRINELAFKLNNSYLGFQYGSDASNLDSLMSVNSTLTNTLTTTVVGNLPFRGGYPRGQKIYIKNTNPLPVEILSIMATLDTQEK